MLISIEQENRIWKDARCEMRVMMEEKLSGLICTLNK